MSVYTPSVKQKTYLEISMLLCHILIYFQKEEEDSELSCAYRSHLSSATAFYFHLLVSFQKICGFNFQQGYFDWINMSSSELVNVILLH